MPLQKPAWYRPHSLQIRPADGRVLRHALLLTLALLLVLISAAEIIGRSPALSRWLPPPGIQASNPELDIKLHQLELFERQHGSVDCLLIGSSVVDDGLDPALVAQTYSEMSGTPITCFNFGLFTLTNDSGGMLTHALIERFHPRVVIYEISARSFSGRFGELARPLMDNAWVLYHNGDFTLRGWLLDHSYAYRYFLAYASWFYPPNRPIINDLRQPFLQYGYFPSQQVLEYDPASSEPIFTGFSLESDQMQGFERVLDSGQTHLMVLEAPVFPQFLNIYISGGLPAYNAQFVEPISAMLAARGVPFLRTNNGFSASIPAGSWMDARHLNVQGAGLFSRWLGTQMADQIDPSIFR